MDSLITTFHIDWKIVIAQLINFGIVFLVLYIFALKPLKKLMSERSQKIEKGVLDAKTNAELIENTKKQYEEIVSKAKIEANQVFQDGKKEAEKKKVEILEETKKDVEKMITDGKKTLEAEKTKMVEDAKSEIVSLVVSATEKLLETHPDQSVDEKSFNKMKNI